MLSELFKIYSEPDPINDLGDYYKVKNWIVKIIVFYGIASVLAIFIGFVVASIDIPGNFSLPIIKILIIPILLLTAWGYVTLLLSFKRVFKSVIKSGSAGYKEGVKHETTHYRVEHEFGNQYKVSSHTENKGCLFAFIAGFVKFMIWAFFCVYIAPFLTFGKLKKSIANVKNYKAN